MKELQLQHADYSKYDFGQKQPDRYKSILYGKYADKGRSHIWC